MTAAPTSTGTRGWAPQALAIALTGSTIVLALTALLLGPDAFPLPNVTKDPASLGVWALVTALAYGVSGLLVTSERPQNPIGWILIASAFLGSLSVLLGIYGVRAMADPSVSWPLGLTAIWAAGWLWFPSLTLPFVILPQVYPNGAPAGPRWRWPLRFSAIGVALVTGVLAAAPDNVDDYVIGAQLPITWPGWVAPLAGAALIVAFLGLGAGLVAGAAGLFLRFRRGSPQTRGQVLWCTIPMVIGGATMFTPVSDWTLRLMYPAVAVGVAIGVIGYDLLGIQVTLRRVLVYLPLTVMIALVIGAVTAVIGQQSSGARYGIPLAAVAVAVVVLPLRDLLMRAADRLIYGRPRDAIAVMDRLGAADARATTGLLATLAESVGSPGIALRDPQGRIVAQVGTLSDRAGRIVLPGGPGQEDAGDLLVTPRRGERRMDRNDERLLTSVAPYVAAAARAQELAQALEAERTRVVAAAESERARLRQDLHDGLGPSLSGMALGAEAAISLIESDPQAARALVRRLSGEAVSATEEVRRVIDDLRPTALDTAPLGDAVRHAAEHVAPTVEVHVGDAVDAVAPEVATVAYRIAAEALTNVARHSGAQVCRVDLGIEGEHLVLSVRDDGAGLPGGTPAGVGLASMHRRARTLGGEFNVSDLEPVGTRLVARLPCSPESP